MIDWECLRMLHQEMNSDDFDEIVEMFFDEIERFAALCSAGEAAAEQGQTKAINIPQLLEVYATSKNQFLSGLAQLNAA
jgi:hypothetical protein